MLVVRVTEELGCRLRLPTDSSRADGFLAVQSLSEATHGMSPGRGERISLHLLADSAMLEDVCGVTASESIISPPFTLEVLSENIPESHLSN
jgi:hypothetical protein